MWPTDPLRLRSRYKIGYRPIWCVISMNRVDVHCACFETRISSGNGSKWS
jgi:hypothetical protein